MTKHFRYLFALMAALIAVSLTACLDVPDQGPPITTIMNPAPNEVVTGTVPVLVSAVDDKDVTEIKLFINGLPVATFGEAVGTFNWDTSQEAFNQDHQIVAYGKDDDDNIGPSAITSVRVTRTVEDTLPPVVNIKSPVAGQQILVNSTVTIFGEASDATGVTTIRVFIDGVEGTETVTRNSDGSFTYPWNTNGLAVGGQHTIFAQAVDGGGFAGYSQTIQVVISNTAPQPAPILISGEQGRDLAVEGITYGGHYRDGISLTPRLSDLSAVTNVRYLIDGMEVARSNAAPFSAWLDLSELENRDYGVYVEVTFADGRKAGKLTPIFVD